MANITLKAFEPYAKWAYIEQDKHLYLIKPPFGIGERIIASEQNLSDALQKMFYIASNKTFKNVDTVVKFLKKNEINPTKEYTEEEQDEINKDYLLSLPKAVVELFLEDLEEEIPEGDPIYFLELLEIISQNRALQTEKELKDKVADLTTRLQHKVAIEEQRKGELFRSAAKIIPITKVINTDHRLKFGS